MGLDLLVRLMPATTTRFVVAAERQLLKGERAGQRAEGPFRGGTIRNDRSVADRLRRR